MDLCEIRMIIEPEIAALAAERATEEEVEELQKQRMRWQCFADRESSTWKRILSSMKK